MATQGKLSTIIDAIYTVIEALTPSYDAAATFVRWKSMDPLETADIIQAMRNFRIGIPAIGPGSLCDGSTKKSKKAAVQIKTLYPVAYFMNGDTGFLGVEVLRADDEALMVNALCFKRPLSINALTDVRAPLWKGSAQQGRLWVINLEIEYMETIP